MVAQTIAISSHFAPAINSLPHTWVPKRPPINAPVVAPIRLPSPLTFTGNEEIILPCSPKWKEWLKFQKDYPDLYQSLLSAQDHTHRSLRYGKILFDKKEIVKGEKDGLFRDYFYDGKTVRCEGVIMDGEMHGEWKYFLADGALDVIYNMKDGKLKKMDRQSWK